MNLTFAQTDTLDIFQGIENGEFTDSSKANLFGIGKYYEDSVVIRWAPATSSAWLTANRFGYIVERLTIDTTEQFNPDRFRQLTPQPILPLPLSGWNRIHQSDTSNNYILTAAECLHGDWETLNLPSLPSTWIAKRDELENRWSIFLLAAERDPATAQAAALRFVDKDIKKGEIYLYRISVPVDVPNVSSIDDAFVTVRTVESPTENIPIITEIQESDQFVVIKWNRKWHEQNFSSYFIERSEDGGNTFKKVNEIPYIQALSIQENLYSPLISFRDSVKNYQPYWYRIIGLDAFGEQSAPSKTIRAMGRDLTPPRPPINVKAKWLGEDLGMRLSWTLENPYDVETIQIGRSNSYDGEYYDLSSETISPLENKYHDKTIPILSGSYYYIIRVFDTVGNVNTSLVAMAHIPDSIPPNRPQGIIGDIDSSGVVTLSWTIGDEKDLLGYHVFVANDSTYSFNRLTNQPIVQNFFSDTLTLHTLTEDIYYKIVAVDGSFNHSPFSQLIRIAKPDTIRPSEPIFTDYKVEEGKVLLRWANSSSLDVVNHSLYRRSENQNWILIKTWDYSMTSYVDSMIVEDVFYDYKIEAIDDAGLKSQSVNSIRIKFNESKIADTPDNIRLTANREFPQIEIAWGIPIKPVYGFKIYRSVNEGPYVLLSKDNGKIKAFIDQDVEPGTKYRYAIQMIFEDGYVSRLGKSEPIIF